MSIIKNRCIKEDQKSRKEIPKIFFYGLLILVFTYLVFYWADEKHIFHIKPRKEIFLYLKEVQPLEKQFYKIVERNEQFFDDYDDETSVINQEYFDFLDKNTRKIDDLIVKLADIDANIYMQENKDLFFKEMQTMRKMMIESEIGFRFKDEGSFLRSHEYLEVYQIIAYIRRKSLKNIFDKYGIVYIDLKNSIKYKIK